MPSVFQSLSKYGHKLLAWTVYRTIELRQSHGTISSELEAVFGYTFHYDIAARLKVIASRFYLQTYTGLIDKLRNGKLVRLAPQGRSGMIKRWHRSPVYPEKRPWKARAC